MLENLGKQASVRMILPQKDAQEILQAENKENIPSVAEQGTALWG